MVIVRRYCKKVVYDSSKHECGFRLHVVLPRDYRDCEVEVTVVVARPEERARVVVLTEDEVRELERALQAAQAFLEGVVDGVRALDRRGETRAAEEIVKAVRQRLEEMGIEPPRRLGKVVTDMIETFKKLILERAEHVADKQ